ncbi:phage protein Gp36 family protein [Psychrobacter alimentarius]|uniref:phage protein Gp36 family protein n=1 Tax=Psychrobacter alimentarius TaxID=261164 RepID=UPI0010406661
MYATRDDLVGRFTEMSISQLESMHIDGLLATNNALSDAAETMNSYLSVRYQTPLVKTEHLKIICCNIARYYLYVNDATGEPEDRYNDALKWLQQVAAGKANVTFAEPLTAEEQQKTYVKPAVPIGSSYPGQIFGDDVFAKMPSIK